MPTFRAKNTAVSASTASLSITKPSGTVEGDVMLAAICSDSEFSSAPSGWTHVTGSPQSALVSGSDNRRLAVFRKVAGASEPASYAFTLPAANQMSGGIASYSGCDTAAPINASTGGISTGHGTTVDTGSITPTVDGCTIVTCFGADVYDAGAPATWSAPGTTERFDVYDTGTFMTVALADFDQTTAAAVSKTGTITADSAGRMGIIVALAPVSGPPPGTVVIPEDERDALVADMDAQIESLTNTVEDMTAVRDQLAAYPVS